MTDRVNSKVKPFGVSKGDYVYLYEEAKLGKKLENRYSGPFVIEEVLSPHLVALRNPADGKLKRGRVHLDRLKMAYVRHPNPMSYFPDTVITRQVVVSPSVCCDNSTTDSATSVDIPRMSHVTSRPKRAPLRPVRYRDSDHVSLDCVSDLGSSSSNNTRKIKRVLGQRVISDSIEYLVQLKGEPAQSAIWVKQCDLDSVALRAISSKPPPIAHSAC